MTDDALAAVKYLNSIAVAADSLKATRSMYSRLGRGTSSLMARCDVQGRCSGLS